MTVITKVVQNCGRRPQIVANPTLKESEEDKDAYRRPPPDPSCLVKRPPVVTVMGHVDHGKTTLLDALRHTNVVASEFGGITQHIGAFSVKLSSGNQVTFLDTPGHAAFSSMRERGANVTDIVVLVVAADDGVMDQTKESIKYARQANVPIVVAINKIDRPGADVEMTKDALLANGIQLEDRGGDTIAVPISALKRIGLEALVESIVLQAELLEVSADPKGPVEGVVVECQADLNRGILSTLLIQRGTLKKGAWLVAGTAYGKIKGMLNDQRSSIETASPATPVEVFGWKDMPSVGDLVLEVESEKRAREVVEYRQKKLELEKMKDDLKAIKEKEDEHMKEYGEILKQRREIGWFHVRYALAKKRRELTKKDVEFEAPRVSIVVKGDVEGSIEAILNIISSYYSNECELDLIHFGVGPVTDNDVKLAEPYNGIIYAFNVTVPTSVSSTAASSNVQIRLHNVIYKMFDDLKEEINSKMPPKDEEQILGQADVIQEFVITEGKKKIPVAGCRCTKGILKKDAQYRLKRGEEYIFDGKLTSMRHLKNEVDQIKKDVDCGLRLSDTQIRVQHGDVLECYQLVKVPQKVDWDPGF
ncbi:translation initiation factor IF-2, mitochondrial-like isoform X3 [Artemia franciscana]|uniref:translation initiation factor IF-2, mitochondrial-like isoform X3 n=1 Tax=Artemia franciscana TaxID=6661 RepID=UPI0032DA9E89